MNISKNVAFLPVDLRSRFNQILKNALKRNPQTDGAVLVEYAYKFLYAEQLADWYMFKHLIGLK